MEKARLGLIFSALCLAFALTSSPVEAQGKCAPSKSCDVDGDGWFRNTKKCASCIDPQDPKIDCDDSTSAFTNNCGGGGTGTGDGPEIVSCEVAFENAPAGCFCADGISRGLIAEPQAGGDLSLRGPCTTNETLQLPANFTLLGQGHTITAVDGMVSGQAGPFDGTTVLTNTNDRARVQQLNIVIATTVASGCGGGAQPSSAIHFHSDDSLTRFSILDSTVNLGGGTAVCDALVVDGGGDGGVTTQLVDVSNNLLGPEVYLQNGILVKNIGLDNGRRDPVRILRNTVLDGTGTVPIAIRLDDTQAQADIERNTLVIEDDGIGIVISGAPEAKVTANGITGGAFGIVVDAASSGVRVTNNTLNSTVGIVGICVDDSPDAFVARNKGDYSDPLVDLTCDPSP